MKTKLLLSLLCVLIISSVSELRAQTSEKKECGSKIKVESIDAKKALVMKTETTIDQIGPKMGELFGKLFGYMGEKQIQPVGPPFAVYYKWDEEAGITVFEVGAPIAEEAEGKGEIKYKEFPAMKVASKFFKGPYEEMEPVYVALDKYMDEHDLKKAGTVWDIYLTDPEEVKDPKEYETIVYFTIAE